MRARWLVWIAASVLATAYVLAGRISATSATTSIELTPGSASDVQLLRLVRGPLDASLLFERRDTQRPATGASRASRDWRQTGRPELGKWSTSGDWRETGLLHFENPGDAVRIIVSQDGSAPVPFETMPKSAHDTNTITRDLTANLAVAPGTWRWPPPEESRLVLGSGFPTIRFEVSAVDERLRGEKIELIVLPQLGLKSCQNAICWLSGWIAWPILLAVHIFWFVMLVVFAG